MKIRRAFLVPILASAAAAGCSSGGGNGNAIEACVGRGVAYFKETGSYPTLKSAPNIGRAAEDVALERCRRTTTAF